MSEKTLGVSSFEATSLGINAVSSMLSSYMGSRVAANTYNSNAGSLFRQSSLYDAQGAMMMRSANAYSGAAKQFVKAGKANAKQDRLRAGEVQQFTDANIQESVKEARQKVASGLVAFASNGVLLEGRAGNAAGMWEQDEAAENSYQQLLIQQNSENQIWELLTSANMKEAEGYGNAAGAYGQAASAAGQAYSSYMSGLYSFQEGLAAKRAAEKAKKRGRMGVLGSIGGAVIGAAGVALAGFTGGASLIAAASLGSGVGGSVSQF